MAGMAATQQAVQTVVRDATQDDVPAIQAIYEHHVLHGVATFEEVPPSVAEMRQRLAEIQDDGLPYLVALRDDVVVGYAYAGRHRPRAAYRYTLENSIYVAHDHGGEGIGAALLTLLIARCETGPWRQLVAVVGGSQNAGSIALHQSQGFAVIGTMPAVGFKHGQWVDTVIMQRPLTVGAQTLPA